MIKSIIIASILVGGSPSIKELPLDHNRKVELAVPHIDEDALTIEFPKPIVQIYGSQIIDVESEGKGLFAYQHDINSNVLSVAALTEKAAAPLKVQLGNKVYLYMLKQSDRPVSLVRFSEEKPYKAQSGVDDILLWESMISKAKAFYLLKKAGSTSEIEFIDYEPIRKIPYSEVDLFMYAAFRFKDNPDYLLFHMSIENKSNLPYYYDPFRLSVVAGKQLYPYPLAYSTANGMVNQGANNELWLIVKNSEKTLPIKSIDLSKTPFNVILHSKNGRSDL